MIDTVTIEGCTQVQLSKEGHLLLSIAVNISDKTRTAISVE